MAGRARVVVPWTTIGWLGDITAALAVSGVLYETVAVDPADPGAYARLFAFLWEQAGDLIVCEHDNVPTAVQVADLAACGHEWCGYGYDKDGRRVVRALGFTRLSAGLRARWPTLGREAAVIQDDRPRWCPWQSLDSRLALKLTGLGVTWIEHPGTVAHRSLTPTLTVS